MRLGDRLLGACAVSAFYELVSYSHHEPQLFFAYRR